jgi:short-subunit dehydrogenase
VTFPFVRIYGASKFAVEALTDSLRYEVSQLGVEVAEVQPSGYPTNFFTNVLVGHSYGGAVITVVGSQAKVAGLVYVAGVAPDEG